MADELRKTPGTTDGTPHGDPAAGTPSAEKTPAAPAEPERTLVMGTDMPDKTLVMGADDADRTIVLSPENGVTPVSSGERSLIDDTRSRIQTILHKPTSILSALTGTGTGKRDVGKEIEGQDHHRERTDIGRIEEDQARLTNLENRFEIERKVAEGGRYMVSIGRELALERQVAVYSLRDDKLLDPDERANFIAEAEISAQLDHPSILPVYSVNRDYRGGLHSAVKLTDGTDLRKYLNRIVSHYRSSGFHSAEENDSLNFRIELMLGISDGLVYAHSRGVAHANLHPQNILIGEYHEVYIKGWGYARLLSGENADEKKKRKAPEINDPRFVAPELIAGGEPSVLSDVYSFGMILYETVTLHPPYPDASAPEILECIENGVTPTIEHRFGGSIDPDMQAIIRKAIAMDPEKRYASVNDLAEDLRRFLHSEKTSVRRISLSKRFAKLIRAHHRGMFFCFLTLIVLLGALFTYNIFNDVRLAQASYMNDHVLGKAQSSCRKTAHLFNLQAEKFNAMLESIKFEVEFLLSGHNDFRNDGVQYLAPPGEETVAGDSGIRTEFSPSYGDSVSFRRIEAKRADDLKDPDFTRLGMLEPTLFRYMLQAPLNASVTRESMDKQIHTLTQNINPIHRIRILLDNGTALYYPYTIKPEPVLPGETEQSPYPKTPKPAWNLPVRLEGAAPGTERVVMPVSLPLGTPDKPVGTAVLLVSGRYIDRIMSDAGNIRRGIEAQYIIATDGNIKVERVNNGPGKPPTVNLEKGPYPDPWLTEWLKGKEFDAVIRKEPGGPIVYCFAFVPAMEMWYLEKIRLRDFLPGIEREEKGGPQ